MRKGWSLEVKSHLGNHLWYLYESLNGVERTLIIFDYYWYNNQINARALIGQSAMGYCAGKPTENSLQIVLVFHQHPARFISL